MNRALCFRVLNLTGKIHQVMGLGYERSTFFFDAEVVAVTLCHRATKVRDPSKAFRVLVRCERIVRTSRALRRIPNPSVAVGTVNFAGDTRL